MKKLMLAAVLAVVMFGGGVAVAEIVGVETGVPVCREDERAWGVGDYYGYSEGGWEKWECRHIDSLSDYFFNQATRPVVEAEWKHRRIINKWLCARPRHWEREHGVDVMPEACQ